MRGSSVFAAGVGLTAACTSTPPSTDPCELDVLGCRAPTGFELDASCSSRDALAVELGEGASAFAPLALGAPPEVQYGSQGGRHLFVAMRLPEPDPAHGLFQAFVQLEGDTGDAGFEALAERDLVFREENMKTAADGALELSSLVLVLPEQLLEGRGRLALDIRDNCDRRGHAEHDFHWP